MVIFRTYRYVNVQSFNYMHHIKGQIESLIFFFFPYSACQRCFGTVSSCTTPNVLCYKPTKHTILWSPLLFFPPPCALLIEIVFTLDLLLTYNFLYIFNLLLEWDVNFIHFSCNGRLFHVCESYVLMGCPWNVIGIVGRDAEWTNHRQACVVVPTVEVTGDLSSNMCQTILSSKLR